MRVIYIGTNDYWRGPCGWYVFDIDVSVGPFATWYEAARWAP